MSKVPITRDDVVKILKTVYDPEIPVDIYELGLIYDISIDENNNVKVAMTLTAPNCPAAQSLPMQVHERLSQGLPDVGEVDVEVVWDPPWHPSMMSEVAKLQLGYM